MIVGDMTVTNYGKFQNLLMLQNFSILGSVLSIASTLVMLKAQPEALI